MATKNEMILEALESNGMDVKLAYQALAPLVGSTLVFTRNHNGGRYPRTVGDKLYLQNGKLVRENGYGDMVPASDPTGARKQHSDRTQHEMCFRTIYAIANDRKKGNLPVSGPKANESQPEAPTVEAPKADLKGEVKRFVDTIEAWRIIMKQRGDIDPLDSMRITIDGVKAIKAGVPVDGLLAAIGATWPEDTRSQFRPVVPTFDYAAWGRKQADYDPAYHAAMPYVRRLIEAGVHVWLHGPAGTSKSSIAKAVAELRGVDYHEVNLAAAMASAIKGKDRLKEFVSSEFTQAYTKPSVLALEEFDSAMPSTATAVNNAIANGHFHNDADGLIHERHPDFRLVATANSLGNGATKQFSSRMNLDGATKDRFRMGRVYIGLDKELERSIIDAILAA